MAKKAAALRYTPNQDKAPKVTAKGQGHIAQKIIEKAQEAGIHIFKNQALADALVSMELAQSIESELYEAVAEVFAWIMKCEEEHLNQTRPEP